MCVCVRHIHIHTETEGLTVIDGLPQQRDFWLAHWNHTGLEAQLGQPSDVPSRVMFSLFLPLSTTILQQKMKNAETEQSKWKN